MATKIQKISKVIALQIGQNFENLSVTIWFDMAEWMEEFPDANLFALFKRPGDDYASPVAVLYSADDMELGWQVGTFETSVVGIGYLEIRAVDPNIGLLKKSKVIPCSIETTLDPGDVVPDPYTDWLNQLLSLASQAQDDASRAETAAALATSGGTGGILKFEVDGNGHAWVTYSSDVRYQFEIEDGRLMLSESGED